MDHASAFASTSGLTRNTSMPSEQTRSSIWPGRLVVTVACFAALLLCACGGGGEGTVQERAAAMLGADSAAEAAWAGIREDGALGLSRETAYAVATDPDGNVVIAGEVGGVFSGTPSYSTPDPFVAKYSADGRRLWARVVLEHGALGTVDGAYGVATDRAGNIYITGHTHATFPGQTAVDGADVFVAKYSPHGTRLWARQFGSDRDETARAIAVDARGNAFIVGYTQGRLPEQPDTEGQIFIARFDTSGNRKWIRQWGAGGVGAAIEIARGVAVDAAGNAYMVGDIQFDFAGTDNPGVNSDAFAAKFDTNGNRIWFARIASQTADSANAVAVSSDGRAIYVTGRTNGDFDKPGYPAQPVLCCSHPDAFLVRLDGNGSIRWAHNLTSVNSPASNTYFLDVATSVATNATGSAAFITGFTMGTMPGQASKGARDVFVARYTGDGARQWVRQFGSRLPANGHAVSLYDQAWGIARNGTGDLFVAGDTVGTFGTPGRNTDRTDWFVMKLRASGTLY